MTYVTGFNSQAIDQTQQTQVPAMSNNRYTPNFRASYPDEFIRYNHDDEHEHKKSFTDKIKSAFSKNNILIGASLAASAAIVYSVLAGRKVGAFKMSDLAFKNLKNDSSVFDIKTSKSLHPKVKKFFGDLIEKGEIPDEIAKRAGILGKGGTNSVLLLGGSGVGKTEVIKAYAKAVDADYVAIKLSDFSNSFVNGTSQNISKMIKGLIERAKVNPNKQLVISLDEVDALVKVSAHDSTGEISKNRQSLLTGLDELLELKNVKLFTSSNANINSLDSAFVRRCGYNFEVPMPNKEQMKEALKFQLRDCEGAMEHEGAFFENNDKFETLLDELINRKCAFGDAKNISKAAMDNYALDMKAQNNPTLEFDTKYLKEALDKIQTTAGEMAAATGSVL